MKPLHIVISVVCVVVLILGLLVALVIVPPAILASREAARRMNCSNNLKMIGLGLHNYHSAYKQLPMGSGGSGGGTSDWESNQHRLSGFTALLPFIEQQALWEQIANPYESDSFIFPQMGPVPWHDGAEFPPFATQVDKFRCPSDPQLTGPGINFAMCYGDGVRYVGMSAEQIQASLSPDEATPNRGELCLRASGRGFFMNRKELKFRDVLDGLANTIMCGEIEHFSDSLSVGSRVAQIDHPKLYSSPVGCLSLVDSSRPDYYDPSVSLWPEPRGHRWADGNIRFTGFTTVLPPNSPSCTMPDSEFEGVYSASSFHMGGCHVLMGDGAVVFITDSIEAGDSSAQSIHIDNNPGQKSPYGLWGALGTRASKETIGP